MQPGDTIKPNSTEVPTGPVPQEVTIDLSAQPATLPEPPQPQTLPEAPPTPAEPPKESEPETEVPSPWKFNDSATADVPAQPQDRPAGSITWTASEFVAHHKSMGWFVGLGLVVAAVTIAVYLVSRDLVSPIMIALLGIVFGVFAARQPQVLEYTVNDHGITIGPKFYAYENFKAFSITQDGAIHSIVLAPLQRFMPPITVYYETSDEDRIVDVLSNYLPFEEAKRDAVDSLMRRVRF